MGNRYKNMSLRSNRGGTFHFLYQRITAIILLPLTLWIMSSIVMMTSTNHEIITLWIQSPINSFFLIVFIITLFFHAQLGVQMVIEDYVHTEWQKFSCLVLVKSFTIVIGLASLVATFKISLGL